MIKKKKKKKKILMKNCKEKITKYICNFFLLYISILMYSMNYYFILIYKKKREFNEKL